jgi:hypothetical protein
MVGQNTSTDDTHYLAWKMEQKAGKSLWMTFASPFSMLFIL